MPNSAEKAPNTVGDLTDPAGTLRPDEPPATNQIEPEFDRVIIPKRIGRPLS